MKIITVIVLFFIMFLSRCASYSSLYNSSEYQSRKTNYSDSDLTREIVEGDEEIITDDYLPVHKVSELPRFNEFNKASIKYPQEALRSGIEGNVILELFIDKEGYIRKINIIRENPPNMGFGDAAINAFIGKKIEPARANGEAVATRLFYPVLFKVK